MIDIVLMITLYVHSSNSSPRVPQLPPKPSQMLLLVTSIAKSGLGSVEALDDCHVQKLFRELRACEEIESPLCLWRQEGGGEKEGGVL